LFLIFIKKRGRIDRKAGGPSAPNIGFRRFLLHSSIFNIVYLRLYVATWPPASFAMPFRTLSFGEGRVRPPAFLRKVIIPFLN